MKAPRTYSNAFIDTLIVGFITLPLLGVSIHYCNYLQWVEIAILSVVGYATFCNLYPYLEIGTTVSTSDYAHKLKIVKDVEHRFASGWYMACTLDKISNKQLYRTEIARVQLLIYKGEDDQVRARSPYCPHLGADIGKGGWVCKDGLVCPFHEWEFGGDGNVNRIPYDPKCKTNRLEGLKSYPCKKAFGCVFVWYDPKNKEPFYDLPTEKDFPLPNGYKYIGHVEHIMACTVDEIHYNSADPRHFDCLHKDGDFLGKNTWGDYTWNVSANNQSVAEGHIKAFLHYGPLTMAFDVIWRNYWLGLILTSSKSLSALGMGNAYLLDFTTPLDYHKCRRTVMVFMPWYIPTIMTRLYVRRFYNITMQDVQVWNNKRDITTPMLVPKDTEMQKCNKWLRYLYSKEPIPLALDKTE